MSNEIQQYNAGETDLALVPGKPTGANLIREAAAVMADAHALATAVCGTQMIPKHFQGKPDETAAAMLYGASLGLDPMQSVKSIYVVHGQAALYARSMDALVKGAGHETWTVESTDESVTVAGRRKGSQHVEQVTWTIARAERAGYTKNDKYKTDPQAMLHAKATAEVCRKIAPDVLNGVYSVEERQLEYVEAEVVDVKRPTRGLAAALSSPAPAAGQPEGARDEQAESSGQPSAMRTDDRAGEASPPLNTSSKLAKAMYAAINDADIPKDEVPELYQAVLNRPVTSSKELTEADARAVLTALGNTPPDEA